MVVCCAPEGKQEGWAGSIFALVSSPLPLPREPALDQGQYEVVDVAAWLADVQRLFLGQPPRLGDGDEP
jgi:hypothetical protein